MEMLYGCPFEKIIFLPRIDTNSGFGRDWDTLWKKFYNGTFIALHMKVFSNSIHRVKSAKLAISKVALLTPYMGLNTFIWSAMNVPLLNFFDNMSQSLQNTEFVSILDKKWIFSKSIRYFQTCLLVFS